MSSILARIEQISKSEGITIGYLERNIGASKGVLSRAINNGTDIQSKWIQKIVENYPKYSTRWLLSGEGEMLRHDYNISNIIIPQENNISIPVTEISVAAGCAGYDNPNYIEVVDTINLPAAMVKPGEQYYCVRIKGESMSPTLLDSSYLILRLLDRGEWGLIKDNYIYAISDREGRSYVKRIKNRLKDHGFLVCMSDNVDKANYGNFNLMEDEINCILYAEWYLSAKMPNINNTYYKKLNSMEDEMDLLKSQMSQMSQAIKTLNK